MGTIAHTYDPNDTVWVISAAVGSCPSAVEEGIVIQVRATALITETTVAYDVRLGADNGTTEVLEADMFATVGDAMTEYQTRLTA